MSHMHLGSSSLTHLGPHCLYRADTQKLDGFGARDCLTRCAIGYLLCDRWYLLDQRVVIRVSRLQQLWPTPHLYVTHVIFVVQVDVFIVFINLCN